MTVTIDGSASVTINSGAVLGLNSGTAVTLTTQTSVDFTSIPSWVKRITLMFSAVSSSGTANYLIQLGDAGGIETTGYNVYGARYGSTSFAGTDFSNGFGITSGNAANSLGGLIVFANVSGNTWVASGTFGDRASINAYLTTGAKILSDTLTQIRLTTVGGTETFDAGTINILYE